MSLPEATGPLFSRYVKGSQPKPVIATTGRHEFRPSGSFKVTGPSNVRAGEVRSAAASVVSVPFPLLIGGYDDNPQESDNQQTEKDQEA